MIEAYAKTQMIFCYPGCIYADECKGESPDEFCELQESLQESALIMLSGLLDRVFLDQIMGKQGTKKPLGLLNDVGNKQ